MAPLPTHIRKCPSKIVIEAYIAQFEATVPVEQREEMVRQLIVQLRNSELKNSRCLTQAIQYYDKIRARQNIK